MSENETLNETASRWKNRGTAHVVAPWADRVGAVRAASQARARIGLDVSKPSELRCVCPPLAGQRSPINQLKSAFKDGTTHVVMSPLEFMQRLAALVPRPRLHLIRFYGVLAPNAKLRSQIIPSPPEPAIDRAHAQGDGRMSWARLLKPGLRYRHRLLHEL